MLGGSRRLVGVDGVHDIVEESVKLPNHISFSCFYEEHECRKEVLKALSRTLVISEKLVNVTHIAHDDHGRAQRHVNALCHLNVIRRLVELERLSQRLAIHVM